jgi:hypothetical protein
MLFIKASGGIIEQFPYTERDLKRDNPRSSFPRDISAATFANFGALLVENVAVPTVSAGQIAVRDAEPIIDSDGWRWDWTVRAETTAELDTAKAAQLADLADIRWTKEGSGTTIGGTPIATDRTTQAKLTAAYVKASTDSLYEIANWKFGAGTFGTLDASTIIAAADAVELHVQACFSNEASLSASVLAASNISELNAIDLQAGWP